MTLVLAIPGNEHVVVAADTYIYTDYSEAYYGSNGRKIWKAGKWLIGLAGSELGRGILDKMELQGFNYDRSFNLVCSDLANGISTTFASLDDDTRKRYRFSVMVCGVEDRRPRIKTWESSSSVPLDNSDRPAAIGAKKHGGIYLAYEFYRLPLSAEQKILLAYHCISAVARHDLRVGPPIHIAVLREESGATIYEGGQLAEFEPRSAGISEMLKQQFLGDAPRLKSE